MKKRDTNKIVVIGAGNVGATTAYTLMMSGVASEIVLIDVNTQKRDGEVMDLNHGLSFVPPARIIAGDYPDCKEADIIIITAGANQKPGETRMALLNRNAGIFAGIVSEIVKYTSNSLLLVVTNPVDVLTYATYRFSGFPKNQVIGSGTSLDTARLRYVLGHHVGLDTRNVHAYIIGEHGDSEVAVWSMANIAGMPFERYCGQCAQCDAARFRESVMDEVKTAAYEIIQAKGATYYAVALGVKRIVQAILRNEDSILTVSTLLEGEYGLQDVCLSVPCVVNNTGVARIVDLPLSDEEGGLLKASADAIKGAIAEIDFSRTSRV